MNRIYHPYYLWEEIKFNMWGESKNQHDDLQKAIEFTGNHELYGKYMMMVVNEWKISCENSLTDLSINRKAWVGHAACALALQIPEDIIRKAWGYLSYEQQLLANNQAERAIRYWEQFIRKDRELYQDLGEPMLF